MGSTTLARAFAFAAIGCTVTADLYVAPDGSDSADGSKAAPFLTLGQAQSAVRKVCGDMEADLHVYIAEGTYYLEEPLIFDTSDSGSNGHQIIWEGTGSKGADISGGFVAFPRTITIADSL